MYFLIGKWEILWYNYDNIKCVKGVTRYEELY